MRRLSPLFVSLLCMVSSAALTACGDDGGNGCDPGFMLVNGLCVGDAGTGSDGGEDAATDAGDDAGVQDDGAVTDVPMDVPIPSDGGACEFVCMGDTPACDETSGECVPCLEDDHCPASAPVCMDQTCVACVTSADCNDSSNAQCVEQDGRNVCAPCTEDVHCEGVMGGGVAQGVCDLAVGPDAGRCVECSAADESACGDKVCDLDSGSCSDIDAGSADLCEPCVSSRQCGDGNVCAEQVVGELPVGFVCLTPEAMAPGGSCSGAAPHTLARAEAVIAGGGTMAVCQLRTSCEAFAHHSSQACDGETADGDAMCGVVGIDDGVCRSNGAGHACTFLCDSTPDCPGGSTCDGDPGVCSL